MSNLGKYNRKDHIVKSMSNPRASKFYKSLTSYRAIAYAEGFCEGEGASKYEQLCAWQYLVDTGHAWRLQGWFGRAAHQLINAGHIRPAKK